MPKVRTNVRRHIHGNKKINIRVSRIQTGQTHQVKGSDNCWYPEHVERLIATCKYDGQLYRIEDTFFYNKYGHPTGWHPMVSDGYDFFVPYLSAIRDAGFHMRAGETKTITVLGR